MLYLLDSKYSKLSETAMSYIKAYSGMHIDFRSQGTVVTHPLVSNIRLETKARQRLSNIIGMDLPEDVELEPLLREQDILYDIDTDISFVYNEYRPKKRRKTKI